LLSAEGVAGQQHHQHNWRIAAALDKDLGGEIARNLMALTDYMTRKLAGCGSGMTTPRFLWIEGSALLAGNQSRWDGIEPAWKKPLFPDCVR